MTDIFISYKSERKLAAEHFAEVLRRYGYSVWFDYSLYKGKDFAEQIDRQIRGAKSLVVLWCTMSIHSRWVKEEVHLAHDLGILIPVKIEPCEIPFGFRLADTIDLSGWDGNPRSYALDPLFDDLERKVGREALPDRRALIDYENTWRRFGAQTLRRFALGKPVEPENGGLPSIAAWSAEISLQPAPGKPTAGPQPDVVTDPAERDWERFEIAATDDVATIDSYIQQYERSDPLWAARARERLEVVTALRAEREAVAKASAEELLEGLARELFK